MRSGDTISNRYVLEIPLGKGGMGQVWRARDKRLERPAAVKVLAANLTDQPEALVRFFAEAQSIARISHPNVVTVLDFGETQGTPFLVMEFVPGGDLTDLIGDPLYEPRAIELVAEAARGAGAAHELGIVHRDIKAGNILLDEEGTSKLADFGIAATKAGERLTATGAAIGSPFYISPEQATGRTATAESDVYALGVVLFELLTGQKPFDADNMTAVAIAHVEKEPPAPSSLVPGLSKDIDSVVLQCLAKEPAARFRDGNALANALWSLAGEGTDAPLPARIGPAVAAGEAPTAQPAAEPAPGDDEPEEAEAEPVGGLARRDVVTMVLSGIALIALLAGGIYAVTHGGNGTGGVAHATTPHGPKAAEKVRHHNASPAPALGSPTGGIAASDGARTTGSRSSRDVRRSPSGPGSGGASDDASGGQTTDSEPTPEPSPTPTETSVSPAPSPTPTSSSPSPGGTPSTGGAGTGSAGGGSGG